MRFVVALALAWASRAAADPVKPLPDAVWRRDVLVGSDHHMCTIRGDRSVMCWGMNVYGEVGEPTRTAHPIPIVVPGVAGVLSLGASDSMTCAVDGDRHVWCWGGFQADTSAPHRIAGLDDAAELALTLTVACVRRLDGEVRCWHTDGSDPVPHTMSELTRARRIFAGQMFLCAIDEDGRVPCLLYRSGKHPEIAPIEIAAARGATQLGASFQTLYALKPDGTVLGFTLDGDVPTIAQFQVEGVSDAIDLTAGLSTTCIARRGGEVSCVGGGAHPFPALHAEPALRGASAFVTTSTASCAVREHGELVCWGDNYGALGRHDPTGAQPTPIEARGLGDAVELAVDDEQTCARRADHSVACWAVPGDVLRPIARLAPASRIVAGRQFTCAVDEHDQVACWGTVSWRPCRWDSPDNCQFERLDGPAPVRGFLDVAGAVALADPCVLLGNGAVECVLGDDIRRTTAHAVARKARAISSRCFVDPAGKVSCLDPKAKVGPTGALAVVSVAKLGPATAVVTGRDFDCALLADATVACWGANVVGQLGDGTHVARAAPVAVGGLAHVVELTAGDAFACARTQAGEAWCWGSNAAGALGDGSGRDHATPVRVPLSDVVELRASGQRACARLGNGHAACWGHFFENVRDAVPASAAVRVLDPDAIAPSR